MKLTNKISIYLSSKNLFKKYSIIRVLYALTEFFSFKPIRLIQSFSWYLRDYYYYWYRLKKSKDYNFNYKMSLKYIYPCLTDRTKFTPLDTTYFLQDTWAARKIFELKPKKHYDVGSSAMTIGLLSQFIPITMVDIRPLPVELPNLQFIKGSITNLPFKNNSIDSISSLCVVEHIGLGRYGDRLDSLGSEKAIYELKRVLRRRGVILFSVPVDAENRIYFNAHRSFTRDYIVIELFNGFELIEEKYQYGNELVDMYDKNRGFGTGLYFFKKK